MLHVLKWSNSGKDSATLIVYQDSGRNAGEPLYKNLFNNVTELRGFNDLKSTARVPFCCAPSAGYVRNFEHASEILKHVPKF